MKPVRNPNSEGVQDSAVKGAAAPDSKVDAREDGDEIYIKGYDAGWKHATEEVSDLLRDYRREHDMEHGCDGDPCDKCKTANKLLADSKVDVGREAFREEIVTLREHLDARSRSDEFHYHKRETYGFMVTMLDELLDKYPALAAASAVQGTPYTLEFDPLRAISDKCEQYWNEPNIGDAEIHAALECIHQWAREASRRAALQAERGGEG